MTCSKECKEHGKYEANVINTGGEFRKGRKIYSDCPRCKEIRAEKIKVEYRELQINSINQNISDTGIPARYAKYNIRDINGANDSQKSIIKRCVKYCDNYNEIKNNGTSLLFTGKPGTGKTMIALSMIKPIVENVFYKYFKTENVYDDFINRRLNSSSVYLNCVIYKNVYDLFSEVRETYNKNSENNELEILNKYTNTSLLILDEVGAQSGSDFEAMMLFRIINNRYENLKPTFIISNLTDKDLADYIGERTVDRFYENDGAVFVFNWDSYRRVK